MRAFYAWLRMLGLTGYKNQLPIYRRLVLNKLGELRRSHAREVKFRRKLARGRAALLGETDFDADIQEVSLEQRRLAALTRP